MRWIKLRCSYWGKCWARRNGAWDEASEGRHLPRSSVQHPEKGSAFIKKRVGDVAWTLCKKFIEHILEPNKLALSSEK